MKQIEAILNAQGVEAEQITSIMTEVNKLKLIPKERFDSVNNSLKTANDTINNMNTELEDLKGKVKDNEILTKQISDLQESHTAKVTEYENKIKGMKIQDYVKGEMTKELKDSKYFDLLYKEVDQSKITVAEDGTVSGFDINPIKEKYADLFGEAIEGPGSFGNPPRKDPKPDNTSIGKRLAGLAGKANTENTNPYFG